MIVWRIGLTLSLCDPACAAGVTPGRYEITYRLEMPHLERYAEPRVATRCIRLGDSIPVLSGNGAFEDCAVLDRDAAGRELRYRLVCAGRSGARADARYLLDPNRFEGSIAVKLGAKNMTLREVQTGIRIGQCTSGSPD